MFAFARPYALILLASLSSAPVFAIAPTAPEAPAIPAPQPTSAVAITLNTDFASSLPEAPQAQTTTTQAAPSTSPVDAKPADSTTAPQQTKRILFIIPNFRSVSADQKLPPTTTHEKFKLAFQDSFDYSAFAEVAILAGIGEAEKSEPEFHSGFPGYGRYYWHSFADNVDGDFMTEFIWPTLTREDPRYYTLGHGGIVKRTTYSISRLLITRNNQGNATPNFSEIGGNGSAAAISSLYYPGSQRDWIKIGQRWFLQVGIDGLSNLVKEFWPDLNNAVFHNKF